MTPLAFCRKGGDNHAVKTGRRVEKTLSLRMNAS